MGYATHGDRMPVGLTSGRERYVKHLTCAFSIVKEQLVKVAHAIEYNIIGVISFYA